jgi:predicted glutamine amidotransferase
MISTSYTRGIGLQNPVNLPSIPAISVSRPADSTDKITFNTKSIHPYFGCRLFGFMSAFPDQEQSEMLEELIWNGQDSLKVQSEKDPERAWEIRNFEGMWYGSKFPNGNIVSGHAIDGSGVVRFDEKPDHDGRKQMHVGFYKSDKPFYKDPFSEKLIQNIRDTAPAAMVVHLREASSTTRQIEVNLDNNHPFRLQNFAMMHNGTLTPKMVQWLEKRATAYHRKYPEIPMPKGTADSERLFLYLMGRIREQCGTLDTENIPTKDIENILQQTLHRLTQMSHDPKHPFQMQVSPYFEQDTGLNLEGASATRLTNGLNIILSDGKRMFLSRYGRNLNFTTLKGDDGKAKAVFVSSYQIQPGGSSHFEPLNWVEVPEYHMVTLERNKATQTIDCKIQPFTWPSNSWINNLLYKMTQFTRPPKLDKPLKQFAQTS